MNNLKIGILVSIITILALGGFYYFYSKNAATTQKPKLEQAQGTKSNFPSATASAALVEKKQEAQTNFPASQPETGVGQTQTEGVGIQIESPASGAQITSPATISGTANVPNGIVIKVEDANGQILGVRKAEACFGYNACPFSVSVVFSNSNTPEGQITIYSPSLSTGVPESSQSLPVTF